MIKTHKLSLTVN